MKRIEGMHVNKNGEKKMMDIFVNSDDRVNELYEQVRLAVPSVNILQTASLLLLKHLTEDGNAFYIPLKVRPGREGDAFNLDSYTKYIHYMDYETACKIDLHRDYTIIDSIILRRVGKDALKELVEEFFKREKEKAEQ